MEAYVNYLESLQQLRRQEEAASQRSRLDAMKEIAQKLGRNIHSDYGYVPSGTVEVRHGDVRPHLPAHITNVSQFSDADIAGLRKRLLSRPPSATTGRLSHVELVRVGPVQPHPTPYTQHLEVTRVYGLTTVVGRDEFKRGDLAIWVPIGTQLPTSPLLRFIHQDRDYVVSARRFRGIESCGVLLPTSEMLRLEVEPGRSVTASTACWNNWLGGLEGADMADLLNMRNPL